MRSHFHISVALSSEHSPVNTELSERHRASLCFWHTQLGGNEGYHRRSQKARLPRPAMPLLTLCFWTKLLPLLEPQFRSFRNKPQSLLT